MKRTAFMFALALVVGMVMGVVGSQLVTPSTASKAY